MTAPGGRPPLVALLTDFGTHDHYVGSMRGAVLTACPTATLVDVTHDVPRHDIEAGGLMLADSFSFFPAGTVFLCVVDPGVGTSRAGLAAHAGDHFFVAPDNGLLGMVFDRHPPSHVVSLGPSPHVRASMSRTFEGRDRFAPVAGALACGVPLSELGAPVHVWTRLPPDRPRVEAAAIHGRVVRVDHFGNVITNIGRDLVDAWRMGADIVAGLGVHAVAGLVETYASGRPGTPCLLFDSNDHLELAVPLGSAAVMLGVRPGDAVTVSRRTERPC